MSYEVLREGEAWRCRATCVWCSARQSRAQAGAGGAAAERPAPARLGGSSEGTSRASDQQSLGSAAERVRRELARLAVGGIS